MGVSTLLMLFLPHKRIKEVIGMANGDASRSDNERPLTVLIDSDNATPNIVDRLLSKVAKFGIANLKRIYRDWTIPNLCGWKSVFLEHVIQPIHPLPVE
jgi:hypothetical protein